MRLCKYCNEDKDESNFITTYQCKACVAKKKKEYRTSAEGKAKEEAYAIKNKNRKKETDKAWAEANREKRNAQAVARRKANKQKKLDYERDYYAKNKDRINELQRAHNATERGRAMRANYKTKYRNNENFKQHEREYDAVYDKTEKGAKHKRTRAIVYKERKKGNLIPQNCAWCNSSENLNAHHEDYDKPLVVTWLCKKHHNDVHRGKLICIQ